MAAQQHLEARPGAYVPPAIYTAPPVDQEHLEEKTSGIDGRKKTQVIVSEIKKHYKLNMLKNFIDQEAVNVRGGQGPVAIAPPKSSNHAKISEDKTLNLSQKQSQT